MKGKDQNSSMLPDKAAPAQLRNERAGAAKMDFAEPQKRSFISRSPIYYGWIIMAAGTLGIIMTGPGQTYTVSIFIELTVRKPKKRQAMGQV